MRNISNIIKMLREIKTGVYSARGSKEEITFARDKLENRIRLYRGVIKEIKDSGDEALRSKGYCSRPRLKRFNDIIQTAQLLMKGRNTKDIAGKLNVKENTIVNYIRGYLY